jgi:hypothetical protein
MLLSVADHAAKICRLLDEPLKRRTPRQNDAVEGRIAIGMAGGYLSGIAGET